MEIMAQNIVSAGMTLRVEPWSGKFFFLEGNAGVAENTLEKIIDPNEIYFGGSLGVGIKTIIGPIKYCISTNSSNHEIEHWIQIGYNF